VFLGQGPGDAGAQFQGKVPLVHPHAGQEGADTSQYAGGADLAGLGAGLPAVLARRRLSTALFSYTCTPAGGPPAPHILGRLQQGVAAGAVDGAV
jgi:hypothetical protein